MESIPPDYVARRPGTTTLFLLSSQPRKDCSKIPALICDFISIHLNSWLGFFSPSLRTVQNFRAAGGRQLLIVPGEEGCRSQVPRCCTSLSSSGVLILPCTSSRLGAPPSGQLKEKAKRKTGQVVFASHTLLERSVHRGICIHCYTTVHTHTQTFPTPSGFHQLTQIEPYNDILITWGFYQVDQPLLCS